jgi:hypothetical protein
MDITFGVSSAKLHEYHNQLKTYPFKTTSHFKLVGEGLDESRRPRTSSITYKDHRPSIKLFRDNNSSALSGNLVPSQEEPIRNSIRLFHHQQRQRPSTGYHTELQKRHFKLLPPAEVKPPKYRGVGPPKDSNIITWQ